MIPRQLTSLLAPLTLVCLGVFLPSLPAQGAQWQKETDAWRTQHAAELQKPDGWLSLTALEWLDPGDTSVGVAPDNKIHLPAGGPDHAGILHLEDSTVTLNPPPGGFPAGLLIDGQPATPQQLHTDADSDKHNPRLTIGTLNFYVVNRGNRYALRIKDANSEALSHFHSLNWYPLDPSYRVTARWIPYHPQKTVTLARLSGSSYQETVPGAAEFNLHGKTYQLEPVLEDPAVPKLFFILRDTTSATTTYGACRFLYTGLPDHGLDQPGELILDFNRLENPPCAYTPYSTCPLPPPQNRLPIALPVGERRYHQ
jgi:uncharacterized protein (DUF1684 family)